jgi:hypothetical protein
MHQIYREVLNPKLGNIDQIYGFMIDLLVLTHQNQGSGLQLDVMDFIWNEIQWGLCHKKRPPFAPFVMHLICFPWAAEFESDILTFPGIEIVSHPMKIMRKKQHEEPKDGLGASAGGGIRTVVGGDARTEAEKGEDVGSEDIDSVPQKKKSWWGKLESKLKQVLCFQDS